MGVIDGRVVLRHLGVSPAFERREHHEYVGGAMALIFVIVTCRLSRFHGEGNPRFLEQLLGGLIQTDKEHLEIARPTINDQHIFQGGYKGRIRLGRNDPLLLAVGLENVFFRTRPIVLSLAASTMSSFTTCFS